MNESKRMQVQPLPSRRTRTDFKPFWRDGGAAPVPRRIRPPACGGGRDICGALSAATRSLAAAGGGDRSVPSPSTSCSVPLSFRPALVSLFPAVSGQPRSVPEVRAPPCGKNLAHMRHPSWSGVLGLPLVSGGPEAVRVAHTLSLS